MIGVAGAALGSAACSSSPTAPTAGVTTTTTTTSPTTTTTIPPPPTTVPPSAACVVSPSETIGPYPSLQYFVRSDIREGKAGLPLVLGVKVVNTSNSCAPVPGAVVDIWQCDGGGNYSQYGSERNLTYLRGLQTTGGDGVAIGRVGKNVSEQ